MYKLQYTGKNTQWFDCDREPFETFREANQEAQIIQSYHLPGGSDNLPSWRYRAVPVSTPEDPYRVDQ